MEESVNVDEATAKSEEMTNNLVMDMLYKMDDMKEIRKKVMKEKHVEVAKLKATYDGKALRLANDVVKYEESCKALVGPKRYRLIKSEWLKLNKPSPKVSNEKPVEKKDPLLREMRDITQTQD